MKENRITIRLEDDLSRRLDRLSKASGVSRSLLIRKAVAQYCANQVGASSFYEAMKPHVGIYEGPTDLSTNPKHMEGFGRGSTSPG
ncbi:MAG: hypothetical protein AUJ92_01990 [Armatimonadetes bacterium CG2_30_59_28]|nr:CopG family transcriptional regulator [Armatimonadota bacterium]OIO98157.1 MAG: hypothetical protein AUJ92_01990 [Armatimonadetes bacterium CG2_30_59_28]PIU66180.1 MAG: hypothetical protein COS85_05775 [Armatimonadetes bacterium CG07_land_8_20_14_0_80_59_28]PIY47503.1 MAG: hypothetical protein COZ05_04860 [Armatimonadetes bacterium CG_4_10_14_3_um_filter_59_10]